MREQIDQVRDIKREINQVKRARQNIARERYGGRGLISYGRGYGYPSRYNDYGYGRSYGGFGGRDYGKWRNIAILGRYLT